MLSTKLRQARGKIAKNKKPTLREQGGFFVLERRIGVWVLPKDIAITMPTFDLSVF